jgi:hypothetical protein
MRKTLRIAIHICFLAIFFSACKAPAFQRKERLNELTQRAIFIYLAQPTIVHNSYSTLGKDRIEIDPLICLRETLVINGKVFFGTPMHSDSLIYPLPQVKYKLAIPDSLIKKYRYAAEDNDYKFDYGIIHQFSPLLPTKEPNIYLMEHHYWSNMCEKETCIRSLKRHYLKFSIINNRINYLNQVETTNIVNYKTFGAFWRKKMEQALPGEKIAKFGI